jgi:hypothetical protein
MTYDENLAAAWTGERGIVSDPIMDLMGNVGAKMTDRHDFLLFGSPLHRLI